ncbi:glycosyltransferase [Desulfovibrionales bacterium]
MDYKYKISIITATYNAAEHLPRLIASLRAQTDQDFEWVVADGASMDGTLVLLADAQKSLKVIADSRPDFGIYDALNRAIQLANGEYYLVLGADDELESTAIENFKFWITKSKADIVTARVWYGHTLKKAPRGPSWLRGQMAYITSHAVGTVFRKSLHCWNGIGMYSKAFPIGADQLFVLQAQKQGAVFCVADFCAGRFNDMGVSSTNYLGTATDFFRIQMQFEWKSLQIILFILRLIKNFPKLAF